MYTFSRHVPVGVSLKLHYLAVLTSFATAALILLTMPASIAMPFVGYLGIILVVCPNSHILVVCPNFHLPNSLPLHSGHFGFLHTKLSA